MNTISVVGRWSLKQPTEQHLLQIHLLYVLSPHCLIFLSLAALPLNLANKSCIEDNFRISPHQWQQHFCSHLLPFSVESPQFLHQLTSLLSLQQSHKPLKLFFFHLNWIQPEENEPVIKYYMQYFK